ncbi:PTS system trehalose-specific EIIBC component [Streptococcus devriesei]|uniref:PTS system trehalose-specific EIIBC component n=1 Tax=Streptococcus devriesei TaxID=231233 RepID=UPI00041D0744|nr:PTS system trehalose-specific EIIBC component [Streptococcus devriesei]
MGKFEKDAQVLLAAIGGKENVSAVTHCATRMRFVLNDDKKADVKAIEAIPAVKGTFTNAGQFQVIIGNDVPIFYNDFTAVSGIEGVSKEAAKSAAKGNQNPIQRVMTMLAEIFTPIIPAIIVGGLILGFRNILEGVEFANLGGKTIVEVSQFWNGVNSFLWLPGEAIFHFLPVGIVWSVSRKMGTSQILGIVLGICLVSPQLLNAYNVASTSQAEIAKDWVWDFGFFTVNRIGYQAQVIPALLSGLSLAYLERFWRKVIPEVVSMIFVPFLSLIPALILAHTVLGPIGWTIGKGISFVVLAGLTGPVKWLFGAIFGALYAPLVITGLHHMTNAIDTQLIADTAGHTTGLWPMIALSNIAQGSGVFAYYWMHRHNEREAQIALPATISAYLGVTEPALFGVNLKYIYPFVAGMIGSGIAGLLSTTFNVQANAIGVGGLPGFMSINAKYMVPFFICMAVAIAVPFALTVFFNKTGILNKTEEESPAPQAEAVAKAKESSEIAVGTKIDVKSPLTGQVKPLSEAVDPVFAQGVMGQGVLIEPSEGLLVAPVDGVVSVLFPTNHAVGLVTDQGLELLMHIGMDTVNLEGKGFKAFVKQGDRVKVGDKLIGFDIDAIKKAGYVTETPVIITNQNDYQPDAVGALPHDTRQGEELLTASKI